VTLLESQSVPVRVVNRVAELAVDRLHDKAVNVRKNALALLTCVLDNNPFAGSLDEGFYLARKKELQLDFTARVDELRAASAVPLDEPSENAEASGLASASSEPLSPEAQEHAQAMADAQTAAFLVSDDIRQDVEASALQAQLDYVCTVLDFLETLSGAFCDADALQRPSLHLPL